MAIDTWKQKKQAMKVAGKNVSQGIVQTQIKQIYNDRYLTQSV